MNPGGQGFPIASLYVGDLHPEVTEAILYEKFSQAGPVVSIRVCRDQVTRRSLGYAYVNFQQPADAERALDTMNFDTVRGHPCRIMWSQRDPSLRRSGVGNIFIKRLDKAIDNKTLSDTFSTFGNILSCKVVADEEGNSKGYGFVHFETQEAADMAITKVNGMLLNNKQVFVSKFVPRSDRVRSGPNHSYTNLYVKNFPESYSDDDLRELFSAHGSISSAVVMMDGGKSRRFGFVSFDNHDEAKIAEAALHGKVVGDKAIFVTRAMKKAERQADLRRQFDQKRKERQSRYQGVNLYIKNLEEDFDDEKLREEFNKYGTITSARVMQDETGTSKGFGFVCFSSAEEATKAVTEMNGRIVVTKPLYVALHQRREERQAQLNAVRANRITNRGAYPGATGPMPYYPPAVFPVGMHQGQRPYFTPVPYRPGPWPQSAGPGVAGTTRPYGHSNYGGGGGRGGGLRGQQRGGMQHRGANPQNVPRSGPAGGPPRGAGQQPMSNQGGNRIKYTPSARNFPAMPQPQPQQQQQQPSATPTSQQQQQQAGGEQQGHSHPGISLSDLATMSQEEQKHFLGERLYIRIIELDPQLNNPELAGKITGMLLEGVDGADIIHILESEPSLKEKVQEAIAVLQAHKQKESAGLSTAAIAGTA